jgi:hypothetical protein
VVVPGAGNRKGKIVDQTMNKPEGHYTSFDSLHQNLQGIFSALQSLQFQPVIQTSEGQPCEKANGNPRETCEVAIPKEEGCRFADFNYNLVLYDRVPGAVFTGGDPGDPRNYALGPCQ